ncbi:MAG: TerB family tellurite resistance protein [Spirochaetota bacterium]
MRRKLPRGGALLPEDPRQRVIVATAVILLEAAHADDRFTDEEERLVHGILQRFFNLDEERSRELMALSARVREQSIDLWQFTSTINREVTGEEKQRIIELLWEVVYADRRLDRYEDHLLHKLCRVLQVSHGDMIRAKLQVREKLEGTS